MGYGKNLEDAITAKGWTVAETARRSGVNVNTLHTIIRRDVSVRYDHAICLSNALEIDIDTICENNPYNKDLIDLKPLPDKEPNIKNNRLPIGEHIKQLRKREKLTQNDFCKLLSISQASLSVFEANLKLPMLLTLVNIAKRFDVSLDWLCGLDEGEPENRCSSELSSEISLDDALKIAFDAAKKHGYVVEIMLKRETQDNEG